MSEYDFFWEKGHVVVTKNGQFFCTSDDLSEAKRDIADDMELETKSA